MSFPRNIFVLSTGRCGSTTLARACGHLTSHTSASASRTHLLGDARLDYDVDHIEIDNRLSWLLGRLDEEWGDDAAYVHLTRIREEVAASFAARKNPGILQAYRNGILLGSGWRAEPPARTDVALDYVDTVTANIRAFLKDKTHVMAMKLETMEQDFPRFVDWIGATGDIDAGLKELAERHNATAS
ncbi:hypothetical protein [Pelagovum pacificum]|uniref:Sulfotransferase family protein n=1 Tax=Pelagovum pacificum TaxID=2588711 RepID=A0A5C5GFN8_9RHOB|nr:hypothetical protein [Pelagovum pacificum]QQA44110.1 hypothetical protein I8N54_05905 [Pelagovum pacificum]TNY32761.1 hypothetical protein FHY64_05655 [Pelagovum pacificum]